MDYGLSFASDPFLVTGKQAEITANLILVISKKPQFFRGQERDTGTN